MRRWRGYRDHATAVGLIVGYDFDSYNLGDLERRTGVKWQRYGGAAIPAWIADMDFPIATEIAAAMKDLISRDDLGYPDPSLEAAVRTAFASRAAERYRLLVEPEQLVVVSDVLQAIYLCLLAFTEPGDGVAFLTPAYPPFFSAVAETGRRALVCDLSAGPRRYELDLSQLRSVVQAGNARLLLLCNPHNPTGRSFSRAELAGIAELALECDLLVVSDEIHADLTLPGASHVAYGSLGGQAAARSITLSSASKAFNLAGLRCAVAAFGSEALRDRFAQFPAHARGSVSVLGMVAALAAWEHGDPWLKAAIQVLSDNRDLLAAFVALHLGDGVMRSPEATYLAWLDLRGLGLGEDPALWLRENARVALSPGPDFGASGSGHVRLNFATPRALLEEMLERIATALDGRRPGKP
ncbi:MAG: MalY/PatB family protein [Candidatus Dormibacteria bacterium]